MDTKIAKENAGVEVQQLDSWIRSAITASRSWEIERSEFQARMTSTGAHIRSLDNLKNAVSEAWAQWQRVEKDGCSFQGLGGLREALNTRQLCYAHLLYLEAALFSVQSGVGSRGSAMVLDAKGVLLHPTLGDQWKFSQENTDYRNEVLETRFDAHGQVESHWVERRPFPKTEAWFETTWAAFKKGDIYYSV